ncbi:MAG: ABC transporter permease [Actinomycetota bacterium]
MILAQGEEPLVRWDWVGDHTDLYLEKLVEHSQLTAIAVGVGLLISLPVGIYVYAHRRAYPPVTAFTGILYTIPSLALFAFLVPYTGFSFVTAEIGLVGYTLLILIRNVVAGLQGVPEDARDAARGMGYSRRQLLWRVELPLAMPAIMTGVRVATVTTIGLVTVTSLIGLGGFGRLILDGWRTFFPTMTITGSVLSIALAVGVDGLLLLTQRFLAPWYQGARRAYG